MSQTTPRGRRKSSVVWNHCRQISKLTFCNYCPSSFDLKGSTSTALYHIRKQHPDKLSDAEKLSLLTGGLTTPDAELPKRSTNRRLTDEAPDISHYSLLGRRLDRKLARALVTGAVSINILDNVNFAIFCESLCPRYKLPSRAYMTNTIIPSLYYESVDIIKDILKKVKYISMTTDVWTSFSKQSYITVTAHLIDNQVELQFFVLDTSEIKERHTSENLLEHVKGVMKKFNLDHNVTLNYNSTNNDDILSLDEKDDDVDFLKEVHYYDNEDEDIQASQNSSQDSSQDSSVLPTGK